MSKNIIFANTTKTMNFEEVLEQFSPMLHKVANNMTLKFPRLEREDFIQELKIGLWQAYKEYDEIHAFSTILTYKLKKITGNISQKLTARKRTCAGVVSLSQPITDDGDCTLEELIVIDCYVETDASYDEMLTFILSNLDEREKLEFNCLLNPIEHNSAKLAKQLNISRQAANQRVNRTKSKIQNILIVNQFVAI